MNKLLNKVFFNQYIKQSDIIHITPDNDKVENYSDFGGSYYYKTGSRVHIHLGLKVNSTNTEGVFTIPEGYRPYSVIYVSRCRIFIYKL